MRFTYTQPAGDHSRFAPAAAESLIGKQAPFSVLGQSFGLCRVINAAINEHGTAMTVTVEVEDPDGRIDGMMGGSPPSISFRETT